MRSDAREAAFQIVFASLFGGDSGEEPADEGSSDGPAMDGAIAFTEEAVAG